MNITFDTELEADGRWIAKVPELAGVMAYGASEGEVIAKAESLALRVLADRIDHHEAGAMNFGDSLLNSDDDLFPPVNVL
jgi:predicted RNase H-like HicB family nuclease